MDECKCKLSIKLVGDGCHVCNPAYAYEMSVLTIKDLESERDMLERALEVAVTVLNECGGAASHHDSAAVMRYVTEALSEISRIKGETTTCPKCKGPADNGHDREMPPNAYYCSKCEDGDITPPPP
jgi:imidazoleglycerol phosphate dehydratase HisB